MCFCCLYFLNLKMSNQFLLDSNIRTWVFLPIVLLTFLLEVLKHYAKVLLFNGENNPTLAKIQNLEMKKRVLLLQKNYNYIPKVSFDTRKEVFDPDTGFLSKKEGSQLQKNVTFAFPLNIQDQVLTMVKRHATNHLPMILAGAWVSYTFSGFVCTKVPFPLTISFRPMLQRNIELSYLDPSWVSSCSWYLLNLFGLRNSLHMFFMEDIVEYSDMEFGGDNNNTYFKEDYTNLKLITYENQIQI